MIFSNFRKKFCCSLEILDALFGSDPILWNDFSGCEISSDFWREEVFAKFSRFSLFAKLALE